MNKYIAKEDGWFKTGSECVLEEWYYDLPRYEWANGRVQESDSTGLFRGIRVCENPASEGLDLKVGEEYEKGEVCVYSEFDIVEVKGE